MVFCSWSRKPGIVWYLKGLIVLLPCLMKDDQSNTAFVNRVSSPDGFLPIHTSQIFFLKKNNTDKYVCLLFLEKCLVSSDIHKYILKPG